MTPNHTSDGDGAAPETAEDLTAVRQALGSRLRKLRQDRELSVRAVADESGVSAGFISQVENGHVMPSVATLIRLASALSTRVGDLFDQLQAAGKVVRADERPTYPLKEHGVRDEILSADSTGEIEVLRSVIDPGASTGSEPYVHGTRVEVVHVLSGEIEITLGHEVLQLGTGDSITFSGEVPHGAANKGTTPAELIWITTPAGY
jgi:transcriptional regulator with XRE-family HTH domain